ncbi:formin-F [Parasteatoda tepidariorum]|uniref:formin-F n=1 Tax=Parasteatoda tepidariorum TaxID=114398 RepID=UPI00077FB303|nr:formin-F [Parasteatoda tepidariorum]XP_015920919.1 formin-F [Parasteatoda tepidariorum]XP_042898283.1 formin-F [Parasteatoda tepidariorum]
MLPEIDHYKVKNQDKGPIKKMILLAKDYVHYLKKYSKVVSDGKDFDTVIKATDKNLLETPKCSQLLVSLKDDLRCATTIFMEDFIGSGGVECLLEVLRVCQARQNDTKAPKGRQQQTMLRKISSNQYDCLLCLKFAMQNPKSVIRVTEDAHGLSSICSCFMSTYTKSRILALQLLVRILELSSRGHALILEALTAIRVLFGEPVRFKFLVGLLQGSIASPPAFQSTALKFLNTLLKTSPRPADRIRLQCELEDAGLDLNALEAELRNRCIPCTDPVWTELEVWKKSYLDMETVTGGKQNLETENERLQKEVQLLRQALQKLEEDKINLMQIELELKEKCEDLNEEVTTLKSEMKKPKPDEELNQISILDIKNHFLIDEDDPVLSGDSGQLGTEEIFIDVPTIRPPVGFRSDSSCYEDSTKYSPNLSTKSNSSNNSLTLKKNCFQTKTSSTSTGFGSKTSNSDKESADSALSESESDSGINWSYPVIPEPPPEVRASRVTSRLKDDNVTIIPFRYPTLKTNRKMAQRSRSEDRRETNEARTRKLMEGETKVVDSTNFFMVKRNNNFNNELLGRQSSCLPVNESNGKSNKLSTGRSPTIIPSYQLPVAYKSNFLKKGHSNCDLYSGMSNGSSDKIPQIPPPDYSCGVSVAASGGTISALVHREITKAVKQISGWI